MNGNSSIRLRGNDEEHVQCLRPDNVCLSFVRKDYFRQFREVIEFQKAMGRWPYK